MARPIEEAKVVSPKEVHKPWRKIAIAAELTVAEYDALQAAVGGGDRDAEGGGKEIKEKVKERAEPV